MDFYLFQILIFLTSITHCKGFQDYNPVHNVLEFFKVLIKFPFKRKVLTLALREKEKKKENTDIKVPRFCLTLFDSLLFLKIIFVALEIKSHMSSFSV